MRNNRKAAKFISIHAPRVGSDAIHKAVMRLANKFQSTLPVWGATGKTLPSSMLFIFQSTLPVWGATLRHTPALAQRGISIHAPRVGSDDTKM